ncbi:MULTISPECIES: hypothetical protein [unclassified Streptomyces]|uniref:hypothetical protein n=1 Tax=unclassified Streptomyces TaxID=2593676 RepID=UPI002ED1AB12|nr:hypothetical protein OH827_21415 [Streptomyces sp. NBC_00891]WSY07409.1 hypothetical protein OG464_21415 [Streptomyces sp. NBC_00890]WSZ09034.1 hypothetical protein OG704_21420 [Streptomyces sp. NBC_00869]WSZ23467.1 hypothetical protein OG498_12150 [Streptomyces sp. NBC_00870]
MSVVVRRLVAFIAALVLAVEAVGIVIINVVMGTVVKNQDMSLAGTDPDVMSKGTWALGGVSGLFLLLCAVLLVVAGARDRAPGRVARIVLICCAVVHGVLGALTVGLVGWTAFAWMMVVLGLIVLALVAYGPEPEPEPEPKAEPEQPAAPAPA